MPLFIWFRIRMKDISTASEIIDGMLQLEDAEQRAVLQRFFKTGPGQYGEGDQFLGIRVPETRLFAKAGIQLPLSEVQRLIDSEWHEIRLCGLLIVVYKFEKIARRNTPENIAQRDELIRFYLSNARRANNWDLTDLTCIKTLGRWLTLPSSVTDDEKLAIMDRLANSDNLWEQRISMVATWATSQAGQPQYALRYATRHLHHEHDLMHKAVGWMLRELGKRCGMSYLRDFLELHAADMPRTALRYAIEHMAPSERQEWMSRKCSGNG